MRPPIYLQTPGAVENFYLSDGLGAALRHAYLETDKELLSDLSSGKGRGGTTALSIFKDGEFLYVAHAGDSRAVLGRGGKALRLTEDHKVSVKESVERG
jgi:serine/threonine protein phosphatase PrpC